LAAISYRRYTAGLHICNSGIYFYKNKNNNQNVSPFKRDLYFGNLFDKIPAYQLRREHNAVSADDNTPFSIDL
jgi:hypothetical protein